MQRDIRDAKAPDAYATITFYEHTKRKRFPTASDQHRCMLAIGDRIFDAVLWLSEVGRLGPGDTARVPLNFFSPERAMPYCHVGTTFFIRELENVGEGEIEEICPATGSDQSKIEPRSN